MTERLARMGSAMACPSKLLQNPDPHAHFVQLYDQESSHLIRNVARYLAEGLARDEGALIVATQEHCQAFTAELDQLGVHTAAPEAESKLVFLDAHRTLGEFMIDGQPDWERFEKVASAAIKKVRRAAVNGARAYGEMVGVLWTAREYSAAIRLEEFWNRLLRSGGFTLFCSYPIDIFGKDFQISGVDALLCDHTHLIPTGIDEQLEAALNRAMDERLGARVQGLRSLISANHRPHWAVVPKAEGIILWLRNNLPQEAEEILSLARRYYYAGEPARYPA